MTLDVATFDDAQPLINQLKIPPILACSLPILSGPCSLINTYIVRFASSNICRARAVLRACCISFVVNSAMPNPRAQPMHSMQLTS